MAKHTLEELKQWQALPLGVKVLMTKERIRNWVDEYDEDGVYVSLSGGKDSTVLLHMVRSMYPKVKAVFVDTGLEYPEIREFVKTFDNVDWIRPKMNFKKVIQTYGYPFISKEVAECVYRAKKYLTKLISDGSLVQTDRQTTSIERYEELRNIARQGNARIKMLYGVYPRRVNGVEQTVQTSIGGSESGESVDNGEYP